MSIRLSIIARRVSTSDMELRPPSDRRPILGIDFEDLVKNCASMSATSSSSIELTMNNLMNDLGIVLIN